MRKLYLLLLLIPAVFAQSPVFGEFGFVDSELPFGYSKTFSLSEVELNLDEETHFELELTNDGVGPLYLIVDYPEFLTGETQIEIENTYILRVDVDTSDNSFGVIEFKSPDSSLFLPVTDSLRDSGAFTSFDFNLDSDVYFAGGNMSFDIEITNDNSEGTALTELILTLISKDNQIVLEDTKTLAVDALFDEELSLYLPEYLSKGEYALFATITHKGLSDYEYSLFTLDVGEPEDTRFSGLINSALFLLIIGLFVFLVHNSHRHLGKLRKLHHKHSLSIRKHRATRAEAELVEKKLSSIRSAYLAGAISKKNYDSTIKKLRDRLKVLRLGLKKRPKK